MVQRFRETDPEVKVHWFAKVFPPIFTQRVSGESANEFVGNIAVDARGIAMFVAAVPEGCLQFDGTNHGIMITNRGRLVGER